MAKGMYVRTFVCMYASINQVCVRLMRSINYSYRITSLQADVPYVRIIDAAPAIELHNASFSWSVGNSASLTDINFKADVGKLIAVVGATGSGKSSLVSAILGDMSIVSGKAKLCGAVAYIPQQAWIFNATVRENIVFGLPFNRRLYDAAIDCSQLRTDIDKQFAGGDQCEIGEKGINLSGGQKQRVNIARGVYSDADIYLFDDPLSALDAHVTKAVFRYAFRCVEILMITCHKIDIKNYFLIENVSRSSWQERR